MKTALAIIACLAGLYLIGILASAFFFAPRGLGVHAAVAVALLGAVWLVDRLTRKSIR